MTADLLASLAGTKGLPPVWLMRQAGRYLPEYRAQRARAGNFMNLCLTPSMVREVTLQPLRRFDLDAAIIFSDILLIPYALGFGLTYNEAPQLEPVGETIPEGPPEGWLERLTPVYEAITLTRRALAEGIDGTARTSPPSLIGFAGAPWTLACYMIDGSGETNFARTANLARTNPALIDQLIALLTPLVADHLIAQVRAGAQVLQLFDSWAGLIPADKQERWLIAPTRAIVQAITKSETPAPVIGFPRGLGLAALDFAERTAVTAVTLDSTVRLARAIALTSLPLQGNIDPMHLMIGGEALDRQVDRLAAHGFHHPLIANLAHGVVPQTPPEHVARFVRRLRQPSP
ncbi:MAG: uroporphyrinogen decarboxylase family protein [Pseudomonadota bacterium]